MDEQDHDQNGQDKKKEPRVSRACDACRKAKVRCLDGSPENPCARCRSSGTPCTFESKPTKRGPPRGYVESLERRLEAMEALLSALSETSQGTDAEKQFQKALEDESSFSGASPSSGDVGSPGSRSSLDPNSGVDALTADMEELSVDKDRYVGRGSGLHLAQSIRQHSAPLNQGPGQGPRPEDDCPSVVEHLMIQEHRVKSLRFQLPSQDLSAKLVEAYFTSLNQSDYPLLHRASFDRALRDGSLDRDPSFRSLFYMVCAIGARFVEDDRLNVVYSSSDPLGSRQSRGFSFFQASSGSASPSLMSASLYDIQCSCLAILWLLGSATPISAWAGVGFAIRRVVDVGAHRENRTRWKASPLEDQLRRRAFYMLIGLDRQLSAALGRPLAIHEEDIDLLEPLDLTDEQLDEWEAAGPKSEPPMTGVPGPLAAQKCLRRLFTIVSRALRLLYGMNRQSSSIAKMRTAEAVTELDSLLNEWLNLVPAHLRWDPEKQDPKHFSQSIMIYTTYYTTQILCHRDFISPTRAHLHTLPSLAICSNAARSCSHILDMARKRGILEQGFWYMPLAAVTSGLILLVNVFAKGPSATSLTSSAMGDVKKCIAIAQELNPTTHLASKCLHGLTQLAQLASSGQRKDPTTSNPLKRPMTGSSPSTSTDADSPASNSTSNDAEHGEGAYKNSRRKVELPMTTNDLSLCTFNGRATFSTPASYQASQSMNIPSVEQLSMPSTFPGQNSHTPLPSGGDYYFDPASRTVKSFLSPATIPPSLSGVPPTQSQSPPFVPAPTQQYADLGPGLTYPPSLPADFGAATQPFGTGYDTPLPGLDAGLGTYGQFDPMTLSTNSTVGEMDTNFGYDENFNWSSLGLSNESQLNWDTLLPTMTGHAPAVGTPLPTSYVPSY